MAYRSAILAWGVATLLCLGQVVRADEAAFSPEQLEFFEKQVRPLLVEHCQKCHGAEKQKGQLRLDSREALLKGGDTGPALVPGKPDESEIIKALRYDPDGYQMPPDGKLPPETVAVFVKWVELGAPWPAEAGGKPDKLAPASAEEFARRAERWSFQPLQRVTPPVVRDTNWARTPIDRFLLAKLEQAGLAPAPETDRRTWIRRVYFDTTGLPPTPEAVSAFLANESPDAFERVVDELLASPHFGERWGRHWLDLARYAESRGHEFDNDIPNPWHYRDYIIQAINEDVPYDRFVVEHMAGDLLESGVGSRESGASGWLNVQGSASGQPPTSVDQPSTINHQPLLATGFWYLGECVHSPVDIRKDETDRIDNMIEVYGKTFLGLTISCARCHDHKFDPISQKDYYALAGYIKSTSYAQRPFETLTQNQRVQAALSDLSRRAEGPISTVYQESSRPTLAQINQYLLAVRETLTLPTESTNSANSQVFEDFESGTYAGWEPSGDAFGTQPQTQATIGEYQGHVQAHGQFFINSHQLRDGGRGDDHLGTLTSQEFQITHDSLTFLIGGGPHVGKTCINLLIQGQVALTATGHCSNQMRSESWDLRPFHGQTARLQIVDQERGGWGNIGIDDLVFQNLPASQVHTPEFAARVKQLATERGLNPELLLQWVRHTILAADDPTDPFHLWAKFATGQSPWPAIRTAAAAADLSGAEPLPLLDQDGVYYSFPSTSGSPRMWLSDEPETPIARLENSSHAVLVDPDFAESKEREGTMRDYGALGPMVRAGRTLRTANFEISTGHVAAWVRGGCTTYVVVDSHAIVAGPLHGSIVKKQPSSAEWHWVEHDVAKYKGHHAHLEIVAEAGTDFACEAAFQVDQLPGPLKSSVGPNLLNVDTTKMLSGEALDWIRRHSQLFGLDAPEARQRLAAVSRPFIEERKRLVAQIGHASAMAPAMLEGTGDDELLLIRGNPHKAGAPVPRRFIEVFHGHGPAPSETGSGRLDLAQQMIDPAQTPLVPRVIVNRIWHHYFGRGIVATTDDFGHMGQLPTHPELLDWLATELVREGWSQKQIHRVILLSAAYRMGSEESGVGSWESGVSSRQDAQHFSSVDQPSTINHQPSSIDPNNLLLHRMNIKRLEGEIIRDAMFCLSGREDDRMYGPSVPIALNDFQDGRGKPATGPIDGAGRRSLYLSVRRNFLESFLTVFDLPNPHTSVGRRSVSNVPAQALALLNSPMVVEQAQRWGARTCRETPQLSSRERIDRLYLEAFTRLPTEQERQAALAFITASATDHDDNEAAPPVWADLCHVLLNAKEFIYIR